LWEVDPVTAPIIDIADAVLVALNAVSQPDPPVGEPVFSQAFNAVRKVLPTYELADLADAHVTVVPKGVDVTGASRSLCQHDFQVDVGVQKKFLTGGDLETEVAAMLALVDEIATFLRRKPLAGAAWVRTANDPVYSPDHLAEKRLFTSVLTVTYRAMR
jgi:hypothetical protein